MHNVTVKAILSPKNELNIYRGCTYGCMYCDVRSRLYNKMDTDISDLEVRKNAIEVLNEQLQIRHEKGMVLMGTLGDPYNMEEEKLSLTRNALKALLYNGFGASIITKSDLILRDIDILEEINKRTKVVVIMAITTTDDKEGLFIEPKATPVSRRIEVLKTLQEHGIPTVLYISPLLPYINDTEDNLKKLLNVAAEVKARGIVYYGPGITLKEGNKRHMLKEMDKHFPILRRRYEREFKGRTLCIQNSNVSSFDYIIKDFCIKNDLIYNLDDIRYYISNFDTKNIQMSLFNE